MRLKNMTDSIFLDTRRYIPSLDGLRAGAVLLVIIAHFGLDSVIPGGFGVTAFFWISGYLLTGQMLGEIGRTGRLDFGRFYLRRLLRLMPAALIYILIAGLAFTAIGGTMTPLAWLSAVFYGANYYDLYVMFPPLASGVQSPLTHLWSLAVEEHFYILWPVALLALHRRRWAVPALALVCVAELVWRWYLYDACFEGAVTRADICGLRADYRLYKATDTRLDSIAYGALMAVLAASAWRPPVERLIRSRLVQALSLAVLLGSFLYRDSQFREVIRYSLQGLSLCVLIPAACGQDSLVRRALEIPLVVLTGRLSYSLYLWHWAAVSFTDWAEPHHGPGWVIRACCLTLVGAMISYYAIELPMVSLRRRAGSHAVADQGNILTPVTRSSPSGT